MNALTGELIATAIAKSVLPPLTTSVVVNQPDVVNVTLEPSLILVTVYDATDCALDPSCVYVNVIVVVNPPAGQCDVQGNVVASR